MNISNVTLSNINLPPDIATEVNNVTGGLFVTLFLWTMFIALWIFVVKKGFENEDGLLVASFVTSAFGFISFLIGWTDDTTLIIFIVVMVASLVVKGFKK